MALFTYWNRGIRHRMPLRLSHSRRSSYSAVARCPNDAGPRVDMAMPAGLILVKARSYNTSVHPVELKKLPALKHVSKVGVVTSALRMPRAVAESEKHYSHTVPVLCGFIFAKWGLGWRVFVQSSAALHCNSVVLREIPNHAWYGSLGLRRK